MEQPPLSHASYRLAEPLPETVQHGDILLLMVEVVNTGPAPWITFGQHPVTMAYRWQTPEGHIVVPEGPHTPLPHSIPPDMGFLAELCIEPPPEPGTYHLVIDLVEEQVAWFSERYGAPLVLTVTYLPPTLPRATLVNGNCIANDAIGNHLVTQLRTLRDEGYQVVLVAEHLDPRLPDEVRRAAVVAKRSDIQNPTTRSQWLVNYLLSSDVVIVNYSTYYDLCHVITLPRSSTVIFDYHGITPPELWGTASQDYDHLVLGQQHLNLVQYADAAIAHSQYTAEELRQTGMIPPECVHVMPYAAVTTARYAPPPPPALVERYQPHGERVLLYVGRMARNKRVIDLVEALALVRRRYPDTVLLLVGNVHFEVYRDYAHEVWQRAVDLGCQEQVIFVGEVAHADLEPYYSLCDLFVTASIHEGFCIPVAEAMAHGKPVVAAAAAALPETVGEGGVLCEPCNPADLADKVVGLLDELGELRGSNESGGLSRGGGEAYEAALAQVRQKEKIIAFVTPRYGLDILGGAETGIRGWAEHLARCGYRVEALTTCAHSITDWKNDYPPGVERINGVTVRRFPVDRVDIGTYHVVQEKAILGQTVRSDDEQRFLQNTLKSSALNRYLRDHAEDLACAIFTPYLFGTTYWGMQAVPEKAIIVPCLHDDEPIARLPAFREMLEGAAGLFFNTEAEWSLATEVLGVVNPRRDIIGYGFSDTHPVGDGAAFRARFNLPSPLLLYSGRLEAYKNVPLLLDYFIRYKTEHPGPLTLVLAGSGSLAIPDRPDIVAVGMISDPQTLADAYAAATVLCQPSLKESFSLVLMEAWLQSRPVLVHRQCAATREHVQASGGGYCFDDYVSFHIAMQRLLSAPAHAHRLGERGRDYVQQRYHWDVLIECVIRGIAACTGPQNRYARLAQRGIRRSLDFTHTRFRDALVQVVERARAWNGAPLSPHQCRQLLQLTQVGKPDYTVRSDVPLVGPLVAWVRKQMTSHLREPYFDPIIERQERFNAELVQTLLTALEESTYEQRRLKRTADILREKLRRQATERDHGEQDGTGKGGRKQR